MSSKKTHEISIQAVTAKAIRKYYQTNALTSRNMAALLIWEMTKRYFRDPDDRQELMIVILDLLVNRKISYERPEGIRSYVTLVAQRKLVKKEKRRIRTVPLLTEIRAPKCREVIVHPILKALRIAVQRRGRVYGCRAEAARILGISPQALDYHLRRLSVSL